VQELSRYNSVNLTTLKANKQPIKKIKSEIEEKKMKLIGKIKTLLNFLDVSSLKLNYVKIIST
jgi:hypothetical protein